jgi:8-amino-7-oxononanoate synthase
LTLFNNPSLTLDLKPYSKTAFLKNLVERLQRQLADRRQKDLFRELSLPIPHKLDLSANDYFQLRKHPQVIKASENAISTYGTGAGASPLVTGFLPCHSQLLDKLLEWKQKPYGMLFNSGFMANQAIFKHIPGDKDLVLADKLVHHSMLQGMTSGKAKFLRYPHLDLGKLEELLIKHKNDFDTIFVATESVFSMDGDYPDLRQMAALKKQYGFIWILDEAHALGYWGPHGEGLAHEHEVYDHIDIIVGTLSKTLASSGGYIVVKAKEFIDYLVNFSGEFIYSTYLAPSQAAAAEAAIGIIKNADEARNHFKKTVVNFRSELKKIGLGAEDFSSQIIPIIIGETDATLSLKNQLKDKGILVGAIRPPTVPKGTDRLRISIHSGVQEKDLSEVLEILRLWKNQKG